MSLTRTLIFILTSLIFAIASPAQQPSPVSTAPQRDPQALALFSQMLSTAGWGVPNTPADATATGVVTRNQGGTQDTINITLKFKGNSESRIDVADSAGPITTVVNGEQGAFSKSGRTQSVPARSVLSPTIALPIFCGLLNISDPNLAFRLAGSETISGQVANRIEIDYISPPGDPRPQAQRRDGHLTVWISASTLLPIQIQYPRISQDNPTSVVATTRVYSDYRTIRGVAVPFHQDEYIGGHLISSLQLSTVSFNTGLSDTEFAATAVGQ